MADSTGIDGRSSPAEMEAPYESSNPVRTGINPQAVDNVMFSDVGINVLLARLKQSISSAREFADFLKKRSSLEDEHQRGLRKLSKLTYDASKNPEARTGSYSLQLADVSRTQERMAANGDQFAVSLQQMHDDLAELTNRMDKERKHWRTEGTNNEKKVKEAEAMMEKAKLKYYGLAEDYDRVRTGEKGTGKIFTVKGPKSAEKHEEDILRKLEAADRDYQTRVAAAQTQRQDNLSTLRPQAVRRLQDLIRECDAALVLQLQKFAAFSEKLLVNNGVVISPIKNEDDSAGGALSMRDMVSQIDNERDFQTHITSHTSTVPPKPAEIRYEKHPTLITSSSTTSGPRSGPSTVTSPTAQSSSQPPAQAKPPPAYSQSASQTQTQPPPQSQPLPLKAQPAMRIAQPPPQMQIPQQQRPPQNMPQQSRSQYTSPIPDKAPQLPSPVTRAPSYGLDRTVQPQQAPYRGPVQQPVHPGLHTQKSQQALAAAAAMQNGGYGQSQNRSQYNVQPQQQPQYPRNVQNGNYAAAPPQQQPRSYVDPAKRVFGESLDTLFRRDELPVPLVVSQCIQAIDLFGLQTEGIYRLSGNTVHINQLKEVFNSDSSRVDFRNPEHFHHDVNSVAGLLKQFFRELPDPLMTSELYMEFLAAARIEDNTVRRDSVHAVINSLPDPNYATLRVLILHLYRVTEHSRVNRMNANNLAICFAPSMMGQGRGSQVADAALQARVVETILINTLQIFDED